MTRTATARRLATGAAYGGGSVGLAGAALFALLREEARAARRKVEARTTKEDPPSGDGIYGRGQGQAARVHRPRRLQRRRPGRRAGHRDARACSSPRPSTELAERPVRLVRLAVSGAGLARPRRRRSTRRWPSSPTSR